MTVHYISYGKHRIFFNLLFRKRKTLEINVHPDLQVTVVAPLRTPIDKIKEKVKKRASWIQKQKKFFISYLPKIPLRKYLNGETHKYIGKQYRLKILPSKEKKVVVKGSFLQVFSPNQKSTAIQQILETWYGEQAKTLFDIRLKVCIKNFNGYNIPLPKQKIRKMTKRWGSCSPNGVISLNPELIRTPTHCIDYVITHELCHLLIWKHNQKFYALLESIIPDWKIHKETLERIDS